MGKDQFCTKGPFLTHIAMGIVENNNIEEFESTCKIRFSSFCARDIRKAINKAMAETALRLSACSVEEAFNPENPVRLPEIDEEYDFYPAVYGPSINYISDTAFLADCEKLPPGQAMKIYHNVLVELAKPWWDTECHYYDMPADRVRLAVKRYDGTYPGIARKKAGLDAIDEQIVKILRDGNCPQTDNLPEIAFRLNVSLHWLFNISDDYRIKAPTAETQFLYDRAKLIPFLRRQIVYKTVRNCVRKEEK